MKTKFDESLRPLLLADIDSDIPDQIEIEDSALLALNGDSPSAANDAVPEDIEGNNPVERAVSLIIGVAQDLQVTNKDTNHSAALYAAWVSTKLMVAMLRYMEANTTGSWEGFAGLDLEEEEGADESDESDEEDTEDDEGTQ